MRDGGPVTEGMARRPAALIVEAGLAAVFDAAAVAGLREDSPLGAVGMTDADAVCVADAIAAAADETGWSCVLDDEVMAGAQTVAALIDAVVSLAVPVTDALGPAESREDR